MCTRLVQIDIQGHVPWQGLIITYRPHTTVILNSRGDVHRCRYEFITSSIIMLFPFPCPVKTMADLKGQVLTSMTLPLRDDTSAECSWTWTSGLTDWVVKSAEWLGSEVVMNLAEKRPITGWCVSLPSACRLWLGWGAQGTSWQQVGRRMWRGTEARTTLSSRPWS